MNTFLPSGVEWTVALDFQTFQGMCREHRKCLRILCDGIVDMTRDAQQWARDWGLPVTGETRFEYKHTCM